MFFQQKKQTRQGRENFRATARKLFLTTKNHAGVAELVYALVLGTSAARLEGSSPSSST